MSELYKYSQFNIVAREDKDKVLLYNTRSLNYMYLDKCDFDDINGKSCIDLGDVPVWMADKGYIVPVSTDEIQKIKDEVQEHLEEADFMFVSIFLTLACNYSCVYCFEKEQLCQTDYMTEETAEALVDFIRMRCEEQKFTKKVKLKLFGGEPLLNMPIIRFISNRLRSNNIDFSAKLYTNGRLLDRETALTLRELGVTDEVVIPLDGLSKVYSKLKNCREEDFYATVQNIKDVEEILKLELHINVSEASKEDVEPLIKLLRDKYKIKSSIKTVNVAPQNTDTVTDYNSISFDEFQKASDILMTKVRLTSIRRTYGCEARHPEYYVVGTKGELYVCEHLIGQEKYIVGNIRNQSGRINRTGTIWDNNRVIDECEDCPLIPICLGQCSSQRYIDNIDCERDKRIESTKKRLIRLIENRARVEEDADRGIC